MRRVAFWLAVALVAILAVVGFKLVAAYIPSPAVQRLAAAV